MDKSFVLANTQPCSSNGISYNLRKLWSQVLTEETNGVMSYFEGYIPQSTNCSNNSSAGMDLSLARLEPSYMALGKFQRSVLLKLCHWPSDSQPCAATRRKVGPERASSQKGRDVCDSFCIICKPNIVLSQWYHSLSWRSLDIPRLS